MHQEPQESLAAGEAGAASGGFGRASNCWNWTVKKWKKNKFPGKRRKEIRAIKNTFFVVVGIFFWVFLFALMFLFGWVFF